MLTMTVCCEQLQVRAVRHAKEDRRRQERQLRLEIDDLRYAYKKLDPPVELDATYEEVSISLCLVSRWSDGRTEARVGLRAGGQPLTVGLIARTQILPRIQDTPEFVALKDEDARRTAFDKFIRRQKVSSISRAIGPGSSGLRTGAADSSLAHAAVTS